MALITVDDLNNAKRDADDLAKFVNDPASPGTVSLRLGGTVKTLLRIQNEALAAAAIPIWAVIQKSGGVTSIASQSGNFTLTKEPFLGDNVGYYKLAYSTFASTTRLILTMRTPPLSIYHFNGGAGYAWLWVANGATKVDTDFQAVVTTFPQML